MLVKIDLPDGIYANGTEYESVGRWHDANLTRFHEGQKKPIGGWRAKTEDILNGACRTIITWRDNPGSSWAGFGTSTKIYVMDRAGVVYNVTPVGFTDGRISATAASGYGCGAYGVGAYGTPRPDSANILDATVWSLDTWGQDLVGVSPDDGTIWEWDVTDTDTHAQEVAGSPSAKALVVTDERIMMALGADNDPRMVMWSDQEDNTDWVDSEINQAGSFRLQTPGRIMCARRVQGGVLILTDTDAWLARYVGFPYVYGFERVGEDCGIISRGAVTVHNGRAMWMGQNGFRLFNGVSVEPVACDVSDRVFSDMNRSQVSKVTAWNNGEFEEAWFFYPDAAHTENSRYVFYSYRNGNWDIGTLQRTAATSKGAMAYPLAADLAGAIYEHETGVEYDGAVPYIRSGPMELGDGEHVLTVKGMIPDERTAGDCVATFYTRQYPNAPETTHGPYSLASPTNFMFTARQVEVKLSGAGSDWRVGTPRLEVAARGKR